MARPTNQERVLRIVRDFGHRYYDRQILGRWPDACWGLELQAVRRHFDFTSGADHAIMELVYDRELVLLFDEKTGRQHLVFRKNGPGDIDPWSVKSVRADFSVVEYDDDEEF